MPGYHGIQEGIVGISVLAGPLLDLVREFCECIGRPVFRQFQVPCIVQKDHGEANHILLVADHDNALAVQG